MINIEIFLQNDLPQMLKGIPSAHAIFSSYRGLERHKQGMLDTGKPNLSIEVFGTFNLPDKFAFGVMMTSQAMGDIDTAYIAAQSLTHDAVKNQSKLAPIPIEHLSDKKLFYVTYGGLMAYKETLANAKKVRNKFPDTKIIFLTCDCELTQKKQVMQPYIDDHTIDVVVVTPGCGGQGTMSDILEKFIEVF